LNRTAPAIYSECAEIYRPPQSARPVDRAHNKNYNAVVMKGTRLLGGFENLLLLAILQLDDSAYGAAIRQELIDRAGKDVAIGAIYTGLDRLEQKGFVTSWSGKPTPERGGRAKKFYQVTAQGKKALRETHRAIHSLSLGLEGSLTSCLRI
jgi:PadR family transcriptional regulator, regulatory protein PadR